MNRLLTLEHRERIARFVDRVPWRSAAPRSEWFSRFSLPDRVTRMFQTELPPLAITQIQRPALLVLMGGTTVQQYEEAGQLGRLTSSLERHARFFRTVMLMTADRSDYTDQISVEGVMHRRVPLRMFLGGASSLFMSVLFRFRTVRQATAVLIVDEESAPAGWIAKRLSGSTLAMSVGAPWAPPRDADVDGWRNRFSRKALSSVESVVAWPGTESDPVTPFAEKHELPRLVDADLYCPLTTTDPARPRTIGVFIGPEHEAGARVILGVAERLKRRRQNAVVRVFVTGDPGAAVRAAALQGEAAERDVSIEFHVLPRPEMIPDAISRMRLCIAFGTGEPVQHLLGAMASGVPAIAISPESQGAGSDRASGDTELDWTRFVLCSGATEEEITRNIETLFREPGIRMRLAREGRRFVVAHHSVDALAEKETRLLLGPDLLTLEIADQEPVFDAQAEAEKLAAMLEAVGVARIDLNPEPEPEEAAA